MLELPEPSLAQPFRPYLVQSNDFLGCPTGTGLASLPPLFVSVF